MQARQRVLGVHGQTTKEPAARRPNHGRSPQLDEPACQRADKATTGLHSERSATRPPQVRPATCRDARVHQEVQDTRENLALELDSAQSD